MNTALLARAPRVAAIVTATVILLAVLASSASAINVNLRVEGETQTHFNGPVVTGPRSVPGGTDDPNCRANGTANDFAGANALTAITDAPGVASSTSGTQYGWGVLLCSVNGESPATTLAGWLIRINNQNVSAPGGFVTATTPLKDGDSVLFYMSPEFSTYGSSLDLSVSSSSAPGQPVIASVSSYDHADDSKSPASGVLISGGGVLATTGSDGTATLSFPESGRFLLSATKSGSVRGSAWVTVDPATPAAPVVVVKRTNRFIRCNKTYKRGTKAHRRCIRIVRAKQRAERLHVKTNRFERCARIYSHSKSRYRRCIRIVRAKQRAGR